MIITKIDTVLQTQTFSVEKLETAEKSDWHRLSSHDYVTVLPIVNRTHAVLVKQFRVGSESFTLETPGGLVDAIEKNDPTLSAARELEEETGLSSKRFLPVGSMSPNPAIQNNRIHMFVAPSCEPATSRNHFPDKNESIELVPVKIGDLDGMVRTGQINHALSALCIMLSLKFLSLES